MSDDQSKHLEFKNSEVNPMFHIDIHGKLPKEIWADPVAAVNLDFATLSLRNYMSKKDQSTIVTPISNFITQTFNQIYKDERIGPDSVTPVVETEPKLKGLFGYDRHTMNS